MEKKDKLIESLGLHPAIIEILKRAGYNIIGDLTLVKAEDIEELFNMSKIYCSSTAFEQLRATLHHDFNLTFLDEYKELNLSFEVANISVRQLELPSAIKNVLNKMYIYTLGELLTTDYQKIARARNLGEHYFKVLKDYVHGLGYKFKNEQPSLDEILSELKSKGIELLEDVFDNIKLCRLLYRNGIYTVDDLLNFGTKVYNLVGFGPVRQKELEQKMEELNLTFNNTTTEEAKTQAHIEVPRPDVVMVPTEEIVEQAKKENIEVKKRIDEKEELIKEYNRLMKERQQLAAREEALDRLIESILESMKEGISHGKK